MKKKMGEKEQKQIFHEWLNQHKGLAFKVVRAYAFNEPDREDLFQEICIQVWNSIPSFKGDSTAATWIYRVALYSALAWTRRQKRHQAGNQALDHIEHTLTENPTNKDNRLDWLYEQIAQLNEIDRSLTLLLLDGFSYKEMADMLGISETNVGVKISRIKKHLTQKSLETLGHGV